MDLLKIEDGAKLILEGLGVDLENDNFRDTPKRVAKYYKEMFDAPKTGYPFFEEEHTDLVLVRGHTFYGCCPHHLATVKFVATIAYIPNGAVTGASKLIRLIHAVNNMPKTQESLTQDILCAIKKLPGVRSQGEAVFVTGEHGCMRVRGVKSNAQMVTYKLSGAFQDDLELQRRFFEIVRMGNGGSNGV